MREALRGPREVLELWATERALTAEPWLRETDGARPGQARAGADRAGRDARPPGRRRARRAVPVRGRLRARGRAERRCSSVLDRVTDPRNLGAVARSAEGAGATGIVVPAHGSATVTPAVCRVVGRRGRARAGRRRPEPRALPRRGEGPASSGSGRRRRGGDADVGDRPRGRGRLRLRRRGTGPAAARPPHLRRAVSIPLAGKVESLNVSVAAAVLLYEARRQRGWLSRRCYLFDGYNLLHAGSVRGLARADRPARELRRREGRPRRGRLRRRRGGLRRTARSRCASPSTRTRCSSGSPPSTAPARQVCLVSSDSAVRGTSGQEVTEAELLATFLARLRRPGHAEQKPMRVDDTLDRRDAGNAREAAQRPRVRLRIGTTCKFL